METFPEIASRIHTRLFVPPFELPIRDLNVPLMVAPAYFQKHRYLLEVMPLIVEREILTTEEHVLALMGRDVDDTANVVIRNAHNMLDTLDRQLEHLITKSSNSTSLSLVPLFYWYNHKGQFARGLLYGFLHWLLAGSREDITKRKIGFSVNRDRFEHLLFHLKPEIATIQERGGAGLKATRRASAFFQAFVDFLNINPSLAIGSAELESEVLEILRDFARISGRSSRAKSSRSYSRADKSQINIRELFESGSIRCHICGGVVNLQSGAIQYDHVVDYAVSKVTDADTGKPTHPFCNRYKQQIIASRNRNEQLLLPEIEDNVSDQESPGSQLSLFDFLGKDFPD